MYNTIVKMPLVISKKTQVFQWPYPILEPMLKTWVPFYSLEHKEFENLFIAFVF